MALASGNYYVVTYSKVALRRALTFMTIHERKRGGGRKKAQKKNNFLA